MTFIEFKTGGCTRLVLLIGKFAVKIPNFTVCHKHFLQGCYANWSERDYCKALKCIHEMYSKVTPTIFCSWFGLMSIQKRVVPLERHLTEDECEYFKNQTTDIKMQNFGYLDGVLVCVDYV
jgi:hypothetical protein